MTRPRLALAVACALCILLVAAPTALAVTGAAPPGGKEAVEASPAANGVVMAPGTASELRVSASDAQPLPSVPADFSDSLAAPDYEDLWTVYAAAGQEIVITMTTADTEDFDLCLWPPGTTSFFPHSAAVALSWHFGGPESIRYLVPISGQYYVDVWAMDEPVASTAYHLTVKVQAPGADIPTIASADFTDALESPAYEDFWGVEVAAGQQLIVTMNAAGDFDLCMWAPGTTDFTDHLSGSVVHSAHFDGPEDFKYIVPAGAGGRYIVDVWSGGSSGTYRLQVNKQSPSRSAVRLTPPAVRLRCVTNHTYKAFGTLKPLHYVGDTSVRCQFQKYSRGRWRAAGTRTGENQNYGTYTRYKITFSFWGIGHGSMRWRARAVHLADAMHPRKVSAWRYFSVGN